MKTIFRILIAFLISNSAFAESGIRIQNLQTSHNTTFLTLETANLNDQPQSAKATVGRVFGYFDYSWVNDAWIDLDNDGRTRVDVDHTASGSLIKTAQVLNLGFGYLLNSMVQIGLEVPVERITTEDQRNSPVQANIALDGSSSNGLGDSRLFAKINLLQGKAFALSAIPTLYMPTGFHSVNDYYANGETGIGASWRHFGGGLKIAMEHVNQYFTAALNVGFDYHPEAYIKDTNSDGEYKKLNFEKNIPLAIGFFIPIAEKFGFNLEASANDISNKHNEYTHPGEVLAGIRYWPTKDIATHLTVGTGSLENIGGNDPRFIAGIKLPLYMPAEHISESQVAAVPAPQKLTAEPLAIKKENKIEVLQNIEFEFGSANLTPKSKEVLDQVAKIIIDGKDQIKKVQVEGHTDHKGPMALNMRLSKARALSAKNYLIERGVDQKILTSEGYGPKHPKFDPKTATPEQIDQNRRVEFKLN